MVANIPCKPPDEDFSLSSRLSGRHLKAEEGVEDDSDDDDDDEITEELGYFSALDSVNPYASFKQALTTFQMENGPMYQAATTSLNLEQQTVLMEVMRIAETQAATPA
ncbi:hypothetical protein C8R47DRAFT_493614 [Mycena vitilis]|nr:hypothetical protein C8R47DRAFT_493614 [Mycena vitilis]